MQKLRLFLLAGLVLSVGSTVTVSAQQTTAAKAQGQTQAQDKKSDNGHRKHWWSMPHFHHKKNEKQPAAANSANQTGTAKPVKHAATPTHQGSITVSDKPVSKTAGMKPMKKTMASTHPAARPAHRTVAKTKHTDPTTAKKTLAVASRTKKSVRHNCSAEESKAGGCQAQHRTKPATTRS